MSRMTYKYKYSIMTTARWEDNDISEWVAYHLSIGFDHIFVYSNDDDPSLTKRALMPYLVGEDPKVTLKHYPKRDSEKAQQHEIYHHFLVHHRHKTEWLSLLDVDEFFVFKDINNVNLFMHDFENIADAVYFNWLVYGHGTKKHRDLGSVLATFCQRNIAIDPHTKMLFKTHFIDPDKLLASYRGGLKGFWHFLDTYNIPHLRMKNVLYEDMSGYSSNFPENANSFVRTDRRSERMISKAYIAHFQFKSEADFMRRVQRGGSPTVAYWKQTLESGSYKARLARNNAVWDTYLALYWHNLNSKSALLTVEELTELTNCPNVAIGKPTAQSSSDLENENGPSNARRANDGIRRFDYGFRTEIEDNPWWMVDLMDVFSIVSIHVYSVTDATSNADARLLDVSIDGCTWTNVASFSERRDKTLPHVMNLADDIKARFVRIKLAGAGSLGEDEVEIYGFMNDTLDPQRFGTGK